ncbi:response regulator transcription factor [Pelomonas sp. KK5]|uniref:response regulator n=1 Tax=Pelomonas sp. KK5 TaxID=1855730 RepID=UPI00117C6E69|nr:response regulator transcription factor [Pelomonas sp. KK5]
MRRVLIVDDHPAVRAGMRELILSEWPLAEVLEAPTLGRGLALGRSRRPDLLVLDLALPDAAGVASGTEGVTRVRCQLAGVPILVITGEAERIEAARLLAMGVAGYLPRAQRALELLPALRRMMAGGRFVTAGLAQRFPGLLVDLNRR